MEKFKSIEAIKNSYSLTPQQKEIEIIIFSNKDVFNDNTAEILRCLNNSNEHLKTFCMLDAYTKHLIDCNDEVINIYS